MDDLTKGYKSGDSCPSCKKGNLEPRETHKSGSKAKFVQCMNCSWSSLR
jgi:hypothetical protein